MIYIGADHRGFELKEQLKESLTRQGWGVEDVGSYVLDPDDDSLESAIKVAEMVEGGGGDRGILVCGSGHGEDMAANKFPGIRAIIGFNREVVIQGREHWDANILVLPADWTSRKQAQELVELFLATEKNEDVRYARRREKLSRLRAG